MLSSTESVMNQAYLNARPSGEHGFYNLSQLDQIPIQRTF